MLKTNINWPHLKIKGEYVVLKCLQHRYKIKKPTRESRFLKKYSQYYLGVLKFLSSSSLLTTFTFELSFSCLLTTS